MKFLAGAIGASLLLKTASACEVDCAPIVGCREAQLDVVFTVDESGSMYWISTSYSDNLSKDENRFEKSLDFVAQLQAGLTDSFTLARFGIGTWSKPPESYCSSSTYGSGAGKMVLKCPTGCCSATEAQNYNIFAKPEDRYAIFTFPGMRIAHSVKNSATKGAQGTIDGEAFDCTTAVGPKGQLDKTTGKYANGFCNYFPGFSDALVALYPTGQSTYAEYAFMHCQGELIPARRHCVCTDAKAKYPAGCESPGAQTCEDVQRMCIVISDGVNSDGSTPNSRATALKTAGVTVITVGIGNAFTAGSGAMYTWASEPKALNAYVAANFNVDTLTKMATAITNNVCFAMGSLDRGTCVITGGSAKKLTVEGTGFLATSEGTSGKLTATFYEPAYTGASAKGVITTQCTIKSQILAECDMPVNDIDGSLAKPYGSYIMELSRDGGTVWTANRNRVNFETSCDPPTMPPFDDGATGGAGGGSGDEAPTVPASVDPRDAEEAAANDNSAGDLSGASSLAPTSVVATAVFGIAALLAGRA